MELLRTPQAPDSPEDGSSGIPSPASLRRVHHHSVLTELPGVVEEDADVVHVAVGKSTQKTVRLLQWTFQQFVNRAICLVHVHQPSPLIPTLLGKLPASQANGKVVSAYRREEKEQMEKLLSNYLNICSRARVKATCIVAQAHQVDQGITGLVFKHNIRKLIMGVVAGKRKKFDKDAAKYAPLFCEIWFIDKGKHIWTREASGHLTSLQTAIQQQCVNIVNLKSRTYQEHRSDCIFPSDCPRSSSCCEIGKVVHDDDFHAVEFTSTPTSICDPPDMRRLTNPVEQQSILEPEDARRVTEATNNETVAEHLKVKILESEAMDAIAKVRAFEFSRVHEMKLRKAEDALRATLHEQEKLLEEKENVTRQVQKTLKNVASLERHAEEAKIRCEEATEELKFMKASISALRRERQKIQQQKVESVFRLDQWASQGNRVAFNCYQDSGVCDDRDQLVDFSLLDLESATCNFSECFKIGEGGSGSVYKGEIQGQTVAIKKLHPNSMHGHTEFQQEVRVLGKLKHPHLVTLIGECTEACSLVYEYMPNGSLQDHLFRKSDTSCFRWTTRTRIITEISSALLFLHSSKPVKVVHGNLKPKNILLNSEFSCKICDFGICKLVHEESPHCPSLCRYTEPKSAFAYTDPEFRRTGVLTPSSDIYAFGLIILQLLTGKPPEGLAREVRQAVSLGILDSILDSSAGEWPKFVAKQLVDLGLQCCESNSRDRPELRPSLVSELEQLHISEERPVPSFFLCPILQEIMHDPQIAADGFTYEGEAMRTWLDSGRETSPFTNLKLSHLSLTPNHTLRLAIQEWLCRS